MASMTTSIRNRPALSTGSWFPAATSLFPPDPGDSGRFERIPSRETASPCHAVSPHVTALYGVSRACDAPKVEPRSRYTPPSGGPESHKDW